MPLYLTDNGQQVDIFVLRILVQCQLPNLLNALILMLLFLNALALIVFITHQCSSNLWIT